MKKILTFILICLTGIAGADSWTQKADFGGGTRSFNCGFSIGNKGYLGVGNTNTNDFWEFDPASNVWTQKANFGGVARYGATGFSIGNKGYIGTGISLVDFWEWDQLTNTWTQKADYGGGGVSGAISFSIGNKGYIGTGSSGAGLTAEFWEWDQATDTWTQKANFAGSPRWLAVGFSIGNKGYIGTGADGVGAGSNLNNDLWEWDQITNVWTQKASFSIGRVEAMGFSIGNYGYIGVGSIVWGSTDIDDLWEYNSVTDTWIQVANFAAGQRELACGFSIGCKGYYGTGIINDANPHSDFWEYTPNAYVCTTGIENVTNDNLQFTIFPNPAKDFIILNSLLTGKDKLEITIRNIHDETIFEKSSFTDRLLKIPVNNFSKGIYFITIDNGKEKTIKKFIKN